MKALTVQQPWAWAIIHGGKTTENRTQLWTYRGPLAIHAGARLSERGMDDKRVGHALRDAGHIWADSPFGGSIGNFGGAPLHMSAIIGIADLVDAHLATGYGDDVCCQPWGEHASARGVVVDIVHLQLANPQPLIFPVRCPGRLGLWTVSAEIEDAMVVAS